MHGRVFEGKEKRKTRQVEVTQCFRLEVPCMRWEKRSKCAKCGERTVVIKVRVKTSTGLEIVKGNIGGHDLH